MPFTPVTGAGCCTGAAGTGVGVGVGVGVGDGVGLGVGVGNNLAVGVECNTGKSGTDDGCAVALSAQPAKSKRASNVVQTNKCFNV